MIYPAFSLFPFHGLLDEEPGEGGGGGGGDPAKEAAAQAEARMAMLEKAVGLIAKGHQELTSGISALTSKIEQIGQPGQGKQHKAGEEEEEVDLETMDRKTFASFLMKQLKSVVEEQVKPLGERFGQLDEKIDGQSLGILIKEFSADHPDFFEWTAEIKALVKENPTLTPARLYTLARSENAAKAQKLDEKYGLNKPKVNGADLPLSFFPTSSTSSATKGSAGKMSPKQAAEAAWDSVMTQFHSGGTQ